MDTQRANAILRPYIDNPIPKGTPVIELARELNVDVYEADLGEDDISGVLKYESGKYSIIVNNTHVPERQRFTIAHELGHLMQVYEGRLKLEDGQRVNRSPRERYTDTEDQQLEIDANRFAAELLMPQSAVQNAFMEDDSVESIARIFKVSADAAKYRLANLGLISL